MNKFSEEILKYLEEKNYRTLKNFLMNIDDVLIFDLIRELEEKDQAIIFRLLNKEKALFIFEQLNTTDQQALIKSLTERRIIELLEELAPDDRVRLLEELPAKVANRLISNLSAEERAATNILLGYEVETAGRKMTTEYITLKKQMTVAESIKRIRKKANDVETIYTIYVTNASRELQGVLSLKDLILAEASDIITDIMQKNVVSVATDTDQEVVARTLKEYNLLAVPVVDKENRLVGIITVDDAMDILDEEATDDILDSAGISDLHISETTRSEALVFGSLPQIWRLRLPFLIITTFGGLFAGLALEVFEDALETVTALIFFIPVIMAMGGNVGTQSSTVFTRGFLLGHIKVKDIWRSIFKETIVGLSIGVVIGILTGVIALFWQGLGDNWEFAVRIALVVGLTLVIVSMIAATLGFLIPYILIKFKADQASGTGPIITSLKDIIAIIVYFLLAMWLIL
ncbi:MAG: magnesium transporter [Erysipelotrichales bacterium]|nr:magnesium transporter [Erysipelotrichales bacterium]